MLSRISSKPVMSVSNKHNLKSFSESPLESLLHCVGNILSLSSRKWHDSLTMATPSFTDGCSEFYICTIVIR